ncbi:hypothetical protein GLYMA_11G178502v4 [Glycine max]|nr:hypothetical protein GLYMA_11G178502v4 [Glycine max]KAH1099680.1 hypothetical protein GYH30_035036 [Glycine max]
MQGITRMDAALDAMRPLGFRTQLILRTVNELLDVAQGGGKKTGQYSRHVTGCRYGINLAKGILEHHSKGILDSDKPRKLLANFQIGKLIIGYVFDQMSR